MKIDTAIRSTSPGPNVVGSPMAEACACATLQASNASQRQRPSRPPSADCMIISACEPALGITGVWAAADGTPLDSSATRTSATLSQTGAGGSMLAYLALGIVPPFTTPSGLFNCGAGSFIVR